jgi:hypothetical protein
VKIQPQWVVTPGKQTNKQTNFKAKLSSQAQLSATYSQNRILMLSDTYRLSLPTDNPLRL